MKAKISILFFVLAVLLVFGTLKSGLFLNNPKEDLSSEGLIKDASKAEIFQFLHASEFLSYSGEKFRLDQDLINSTDIITIHFWASWCAPCVNEVPELIEFAQRITKKNNLGAKTIFVTVSLDDSQEDLNKFLKSFPEFNKEPFFRIWDKEKGFSKLINADRLPMTVILNKNIPEPRIVRGVVEWKSISF